jgi:hypothetical protein
MHDGNFLRRRWRIALEPADRRPGDRLRFALILVDLAFPAFDFMLPGIRARAFEVIESDLVGISLGDLAKRREELMPDLRR